MRQLFYELSIRLTAEKRVVSLTHSRSPSSPPLISVGLGLRIASAAREMNRIRSTSLSLSPSLPPHFTVFSPLLFSCSRSLGYYSTCSLFYLFERSARALS